MKKFSNLVTESKITIDDIDDFFLDFVDDKHSISDLVKFKNVDISPLYITSPYRPQVCIEYLIDKRFYSISNNNVDLFTKFLSCVNENCIRWNLEYKIILGNEGKLIIFKEVPDIIKKYHRERGLLGFIGWSGRLNLKFEDDTIGFMTLISVNRDLDFIISLRCTSGYKWTDKNIIDRISNNKEESISVIRNHFQSHGLQGDITMEESDESKVKY